MNRVVFLEDRLGGNVLFLKHRLLASYMSSVGAGEADFVSPLEYHLEDLSRILDQSDVVVLGALCIDVKRLYPLLCDMHRRGKTILFFVGDFPFHRGFFERCLMLRHIAAPIVLSTSFIAQLRHIGFMKIYELDQGAFWFEESSSESRKRRPDIFSCLTLRDFPRPYYGRGHEESLFRSIADTIEGSYEDSTTYIDSLEHILQEALTTSKNAGESFYCRQLETLIRIFSDAYDYVTNKKRINIILDVSRDLGEHRLVIATNAMKYVHELLQKNNCVENTLIIGNTSVGTTLKYFKNSFACLHVSPPYFQMTHERVSSSLLCGSAVIVSNHDSHVHKCLAKQPFTGMLDIIPPSVDNTDICAKVSGSLYAASVWRIIDSASD